MQTQISRVVESLGGKSVVGNVNNELELIDILSKGLPLRAGTEIKKRFHYTDNQMAKALSLTPKTYRSRKAFNIIESDRLFVHAKIYSQAIDTFENEDLALEWLNKPQTALGGRIPIEMLETTAGQKLVGDLLTRIDYGVYS
jgi:putative toxin-antitoxin system antitoxin component (TIGR02293 family)